MARQKKIKVVQEEQQINEVDMTVETQVDLAQELEAVQQELDRVRLENSRLQNEAQERIANAKRDISPQEATIVEKQVNNNNKSEAKKKIIEQQKAFDSVMVKGRFINRRAPGQPAKLAYMKYEDDPVKWYTFEDGKVYTIPRGFADQINEYYHTPHFIQKAGEMDPNKPSSAIHDVDTSNKKYNFAPVNF